MKTYSLNFFFHELWAVLKNPRLFLTLSKIDVKIRYHGTFFGFFWTILSTLFLITSYSILVKVLFSYNLHDVIPFVTMGMLVWYFLYNSIVDSCYALSSNALIINNIAISPLVFLLRTTFKNFIIFLMSLPVGIFIVLIYNPFSFKGMLFFIAGCFLVALFILCFSLVIGPLCSRFKDLTHLTIHLLSSLMFFTPVVWKKQSLGKYQIIADYNPFSLFLDITRGSLLTGKFDAHAFFVCTMMTLTAFICGAMIYTAHRPKLNYYI